MDGMDEILIKYACFEAINSLKRKSNFLGSKFFTFQMSPEGKCSTRTFQVPSVAESRIIISINTPYDANCPKSNAIYEMNNRLNAL